MWDDEGFETSDSVRETVDWMNELRANAQTADEEAADRANCARGVHRLVNAPGDDDQCEVCGTPDDGYDAYARELSEDAQRAEQRATSKPPLEWGADLGDGYYFCSSCWFSGDLKGAHPDSMSPCDPIQRRDFG